MIGFVRSLSLIVWHYTVCLTCILGYFGCALLVCTVGAITLYAVSIILSALFSIDHWESSVLLSHLSTSALLGIAGIGTTLFLWDFFALFERVAKRSSHSCSAQIVTAWNYWSKPSRQIRREKQVIESQNAVIVLEAELQKASMKYQLRETAARTEDESKFKAQMERAHHKRVKNGMRREIKELKELKKSLKHIQRKIKKCKANQNFHERHLNTNHNKNEGQTRQLPSS